MLFGVLLRGRIPLWVVAGSAAIGLVGHFYLNLFDGVENPAVSASYAILVSLTFGVAALLISRGAQAPTKKLSPEA